MKNKNTVKEFFKTTLFLYILVNQVCAQSVQELIEKGNALYNSHAYEKAQGIYEEAIRKDLSHQWPQTIFNLGNSLFQQKKYNEAAEQFRSLSKSNSFPELKAPATYNLGNCFLEQKNYEAAVAAYKETLKLNPKDEDARYNLWYAHSLMTQGNQSMQQKLVNEKEPSAPPPPTNLTPEDLQRMLQELNTAENQTLQNRKKPSPRRKKEVDDW